ncbi:MAG: hypothetical protein WBD55_01615 [Dehalococcoidia bacterium]
MTEELEQQIRAHLQSETAALRAPSDMWSRVQTVIQEPPRWRTWLAGRQRWLVMSGLAVAGAIALLVLSVVISRPGNDEPLNASSILARAAQAAEDPNSTGVDSFMGKMTGTLTFNIEGIDDIEALDLDPSDLHVGGASEVWFKAPDRYRVEAEDGSVVVFDGDQVSQYDAKSGTYSQRSVEIGDRLFFLPNSEYLSGQLGSPPEFEGLAKDAMVTAGEPVLGRETYLIEQTFGDGSSRMWVDKERFMILRSELTATNSWTVPGGKATMTLDNKFAFTSLDFDASIDDDLFEFTPPPGAVERGPFSGLPPWALVPNPIPDGYKLCGTSRTDSFGGGPLSDIQPVYYGIETADGGLAKVSQRLVEFGDADEFILSTAGIPTPSEPVRVRGQEAAFGHAGSELTVLRWTENGVVIRFVTTDLSDDQLIRLAESMERADELPSSGAGTDLKVHPCEAARGIGGTFQVAP